MSTTVTYKGNTLTTVNNATKTLKTAGKYMEDDIALTDATVDLSSDTVTPATLMQGYTAHDASGAAIVGTATGGSIIIRDEADSHGGTIRHITGGSIVQGTKVITENGTYDVAAYADVNVSVPTGGNAYQDENGYVVLRDGESTAPQGTLSITANGTYDVTGYAGTTVDVVKTYTATISGSGHFSKCCVQKNGTGTAYYTNGDTFTFTDDDDLSIRYASASSSYNAYLMVNGVAADNTNVGIKTYTITKPRADVTIELAYSTTSDVTVNIVASVVTVTANGFSPVGGHVLAKVDVPGMSETDLKTFIERRGTFTDINWPNGLTRIGKYAFAGCSYFNSSSLPDGITSIETYAFYTTDLSSLTELPSGLETIGAYAFFGANLALTSLPDTVTTISDYAFRNCTKLALTSLPNSLSGTIGSFAFGADDKITLSVIPSGVTKIASYAFSNCSGIQSISCDGTIAFLESNAFTGSSTHPMSLASASFPNMALTSNIGTVFGHTTAANACQLLEFCDIGSTTGIASNAFANCYKLQTLVLRKTASVCTLANVSAFTNTPMSGYNSLTGKVYVPSALIETYKTATNWKTLYDAGTVEFLAIEGSDYER